MLWESYVTFDDAMCTRAIGINMLKSQSASELLDGFGVRLTTARLAAGFETRKAAADEIGVDQNTYSPWERGRSYPSVKELLTIRTLYQVSIDWLLHGDESNLAVQKYRGLKEHEATAITIKDRRDLRRMEKNRAIEEHRRTRNPKQQSSKT